MKRIITLVFLSLGSWALSSPVAFEQEPTPTLPRASPTPDPAQPRATNRTIYSDQTELFITFRPPFIVGQVVRVGAHLSKLGDRFLPYADATVAATLTVSDAAVTASVPKPDRPGVFRLVLTPQRAGKGVLVIDISGADGADRLVLDDVDVYPDRATALAHQGPDPEAGAIRYTKEHSWDDNEYASGVIGKTIWPGVGRAKGVLAVPRTAIVDVNGTPCVYVQRHPEAFDLRAVRVGRTDGAWVEILEGLEEGQRIVTRGGSRMPRK